MSTTSSKNTFKPFRMKPAHAKLSIHFILISILSIHLTCCCANAHRGMTCHQNEKQALWRFKQGKHIGRLSRFSSTHSYSSYGSLTRLEFWDPDVDCCSWNGVVCNNITGHVVELHLAGSDYSAELDDHLLLHLTHLTHLDLSFNGFQGALPRAANITKLQYFNISNNHFNSTIPDWLYECKHLEHLDLSFNHFQGALPRAANITKLQYFNINFNHFSSTVPDWLYECNHLEHLDQSFNHFQGALPRAANITKFKYFDISYNDFNSTIPDWLYECKHLEYLDLSHNSFQGALPRAANRGMTRHENEKQALLSLKISSWKAVIADLSFKPRLLLPSWNADVDCCSWGGVLCNNITGHVVELHLGDSGLSGELDDHFLLNLTHLTYLDLSNNHFQGALPRAANITKLQYLNINFNHFSSTVPDWLYECKHLEHLGADGNSLQGSISNSIGNLTSLNYLDLSNNMLSGEIPKIAKLCLQSLRLSNNKFGGDSSNDFANMSNCFLQSLEYLDLSANQLQHLSFGEFKRLTYIDVSQNKLSGPLPSNLGKCVSLITLDVSDNKFTGNLPEIMGQLFKLERFDISNNMLEGIVSETHFANLTNLIEFTASGNHLTLNVSDNWIPNFNLSTLELGSWNLGAERRIPKWIHTQKYLLSSLDLSNTGIADQIPRWFFGFSDLNLSNNSFSGNLHELLCVSNSNETFSMLFDLNLEGNLLSGEFPDCIMKYDSLIVLNLGNNSISGRIPESIGNLSGLQILNLFNNRLSGKIPSSMQNCTRLWKIDLSSNQLIGKLPSWMGTELHWLNFLILRSNKLAGTISSDICRLDNLRILDLSGNKFSGNIPKCMDKFIAMASSEWLNQQNLEEKLTLLHQSATVATKGMRLHYDTILSQVTNIDLSSNNFSGDIPKQLASLAELRSLNLSRNHLNGKIPNGMEGMKVLESLDLSNNFLSGNIPQGITALSSLSYLDLSYNNLSGEIPQSTQFCTFNNSSFVGNKLCGPPLTSSCNDDEIPARSVPGGHEKDEDGKSGIEWMYVFVSLGYAVGLALVCNLLVFKKSWRDAFLGSVDNMWNKLFANAHKERIMCG